uniref:Uncharacterized protein n=1 Tax=Octactis speculum TaxID=3111310 RepID=A0A7S2F7H5_9STRA|mmetsp:Transcript_15041/g.20118  ORF Transcript_15041/g.20118 Transcript_15041/m.20118 type:complete len:390 (+) Transcript_15041:68-1237(+)|eukprot:CAMPEP_0185772592 /NCGR_PEP_ID=MMETSP1174-20130828/69792_1 /TAXON_ID=35687 /ORGANISM="Dictyocha speculum, Strain CCMP1381" /LENGTH=389 /DNA_ID=CAMNT_0028458941 /DNA_START=63 /DNA_END=1232 /DNA_ORIENTATION=+
MSEPPSPSGPPGVKRTSSGVFDNNPGGKPVQVSTVLDEEKGGLYHAETTSGELIMTNPGWELDEDDDYKDDGSMNDYDSMEENGEDGGRYGGKFGRHDIDGEDLKYLQQCLCVHHKCCSKTPWITGLVFIGVCAGLLAFNVEFSKVLLLGKVAGLEGLTSLHIYTTWLGVIMVLVNSFIVWLKVLGSGAIKEIFCDLIKCDFCVNGMITACLRMFFSTDRSCTVMMMTIVSYILILLIFPAFLTSVVLFYFIRSISVMCANGDAGDAYRFFKLMADNVNGDFGGVVVSEICDSIDEAKSLSYNMIVFSIIVVNCQIFMTLLTSEEHILIKHDAIQSMAKSETEEKNHVEELLHKSNRVTREDGEYHAFDFKSRLAEERGKQWHDTPPVV